jgi:transglutaminase-like putative cysteine protease
VGSVSPARDFLARAQFEANRHGADPWVFVRELLQNARDAGARRVSFTTRAGDGTEWLSCRDDGDGMSFSHARRYLFSLYSSSKEGRAAAAGRFGVGFWSILRAGPTALTVRSWPRQGPGWEVRLDADLTRATRKTLPPGGRGTEVLLERARTDGHLSARVLDAVHGCARGLGRRDGPRRTLDVRVDGKIANKPLALPAPSLSFRRGGLRGVVGLGPSPRAELFSKGLRIRSATFLHDLLAPEGRQAARRDCPELAEGLAPQALLDGEGLEPLLSRTDVREDRELRRLVRLARNEIQRLIEGQLDRVRPRGPWRRLADSVRDAPVVAGAIVIAGSLALFLVMLLGVPDSLRGWRPQQPRTQTNPGVRLAPTSADGTRPYADLGNRYRGPEAGPLDRSYLPVDLTYSPATVDLHFAALVLDRLPGRGTTAADLLDASLPPYQASMCTSGCIDVKLGVQVDVGPGPLRIPLPTGHLLDPASLRLGTRPLPVHVARLGEPFLWLGEPTDGTLLYRTYPGLPRGTAEPPARPRELPAVLRRQASALASLPPPRRVPAAAAWVRRHVRYSGEPQVVARHGAASREGVGFAARTLAIGAGDCDVQNGLLLLLLQATDVPARLAVGYVGHAGQTAPWLHSWVEYRTPNGPWGVIDASEGALPLGAGPAAAPRSEETRQPADTPGPAPRSTDAAGRSEGPPPGADGRSPMRREWLLAPLLLIPLLLFGLSRTRRRIHLDPAHDISALLQGALRQPEAFQDLPAVFFRRLVPLHGGRTASLAELWDLATNSRLYCAKARTDLAARAVRLGLRVVDATTQEGARVADALGATDLDEWQALLTRSRSVPLLEAASLHLGRFGDRVRPRVAADSAEPAILVLRPETRGWRQRGAHWVVLGARTPWLDQAQALWRRWPARAPFTAADRLLDLMAWQPARRARALAPLAEAALLENGTP